MKQNHNQDSQDNEMILYRVEWSPARFGGKVGKNKPFEKGKDLLRPAKLKEIVPEKEDYFLRPNGEGNKYYLLLDGFHRKTDYNSIKQFVEAKMVYVKKDYGK